MEQIRRIFSFPVRFLEAYPTWWLIVVVVLVVADLTSKKIVTNKLDFNLTTVEQIERAKGHPINALEDQADQVDLLGERGDLLKLRLVFNDRFVFGSGPSAPITGFFLTLGAIIFLFFYRWHNHLMGHRLAWLFVFSGALGNLIDKMFIKSLADRSWVLSIVPQPGHVSGVVDFVEAIWFGMRWPLRACVDLPIVDHTCPFLPLAWDTWPTFNLADSLIVVGIVLLFITMREVKRANG